MADQNSIYEISSFTGLSDYEDRGAKGAFKFGSNLDVRKAVDSLSCGQALVDEGLHSSRSPSASISPSISVSFSPSVSVSSSASPSTGESPSPSVTPSVSVSLSPSTTQSSSISLSPSPSGGAGVSTVYQDLVKTFVVASDGFTYEFGNTGFIYRRDADGVVQIVYKDPYGEIKGAAEWYDDSKNTYLFWATDTRLNRKKLPGLGNWNDVNVGNNYPKQNLNSGVPHTMALSGGSLVICNGSWLALVGYDGSYTNEAVDLIPGNYSKTIVERNGRAIVGTYNNEATGVNASIDSEVPLSQVGTNGDIYYTDMNNSIPVKKLPGGGKCNPGGVVNMVNQATYFEWEQNALSWIDKQGVGNLALFGIYNATTGKNGVYSYGRLNKNKPFVLNLEYLLDVDEIGALANVSGTILMSYRDGSTFGVKAVDSTTKAQGIYEGLDFKAPTKLNEQITAFKTVELYMKPLPDGANIEFWYRMNKSGNFVRARTAEGETSYTKPGGIKATFTIQSYGDIYEPRIVMNPVANSSPEIYRIRTYFS